MELLNNYWSAQTTYFLVIFLVLILISIRKRALPLTFSVDTTNELRGLAILGVIFAHISYGMFYSTNYLFPLAVWAGVAVNLFFIISGFGLATSAFKRTLSVKDFYWRRLTKIAIPVWLSLVVFIAVDAIFLKKFYGWTEIWQSFLLFFPKADLFLSINSPLWFITPLVFFYLVFPIVFKKNRPWISTILMFVLSLFLIFPALPISEQIKSFYETHFLAFPFGVLMAVIFNRFSLVNGKQKIKLLAESSQKWLAKKWHLIRLIIVLLLIFLTYFLAVNSGIGKGAWVEQSVSLVTAIVFVMIFLLKPVESKLLRFIGDNSLEIYLIHWPLLYRYGFLVDTFGPWLGTLVGLILVIVLAYFFKLFDKQLEKRWF